MANTNRKVTPLGPNPSSQSESVTLASDHPPLNKGGTSSYGTVVTVGATATLLKAANTRRVRLTITNLLTSTARIYIGYDNTLTAGIEGKNVDFIDPGEPWDEGDYTGAVYGICDTGLSAKAHPTEVAQP